jgi:hypothetical protein
MWQLAMFYLIRDIFMPFNVPLSGQKYCWPAVGLTPSQVLMVLLMCHALSPKSLLPLWVTLKFSSHHVYFRVPNQWPLLGIINLNGFQILIQIHILLHQGTTSAWYPLVPNVSLFLRRIRRSASLFLESLT